jgi:hypothetical protein
MKNPINLFSRIRSGAARFSPQASLRQARHVQIQRQPLSTRLARKSVSPLLESLNSWFSQVAKAGMESPFQKPGGIVTT